MQLAVLGATGGLGRQVVRQAKEAGHSVRALIRTPRSDLGELDVRVGDLSDADAIRATLEGADAVISCVGVTGKQDPEVFGDGLRTVLATMKELDIRRIVAISGAGLELEGDTGGFGRKVIIFLLKVFSPRVLEGKQLEYEAIAASDRDWTLVRVARMVERPPKGDVRVDLKAVEGSPMVAYADVARWMVQVAEGDRYVRQAPFVSGG